ncbi:MAG: hypothetical protein C0173_05105 [Desulfurella sp.]|uniref:hypothetical protein n=1 Tax=Desulfurella sp. TaxID=1962857 RepID=UPI000CBDCE35|nr:hypothetical protein [Desulfurella sp.]PMP89897.1 MAG: hypothetical protein C0173_05105 [Desulfurella sp.]HEX14108.1 hypothetical protein [Desulfurella acetivorans]
MWVRGTEIVLGIISIILIMYISKSVFNIQASQKQKTQISSYAEDIHIIRLSDNSTQIVNASFAQYIGSTIFAKNASFFNKGKSEFQISASKLYIYQNNNASLIGNCTAKGKNFLVKTQKAYWDNANETLSSNINTRLESEKIDIKKSNGFVYNKNTNTLVVYKVDLWIK